MKSLVRNASLAILAAAVLCVSAPAQAAGGSSAATGEYNFKFTGGSSTTTTVTIGGVEVTIVKRTINCAATGNDCKYTAAGFEPKM